MTGINGLDSGSSPDDEGEASLDSGSSPDDEGEASLDSWSSSEWIMRHSI